MPHTALQHTATHCNTLQHTATHSNTLQHIATYCNTLQHIATHCNTPSTSVPSRAGGEASARATETTSSSLSAMPPDEYFHRLQVQCAAVCCSVVHRVAVCCCQHFCPRCPLMLQCSAVCCSVLQRVAACCSVLQRVAACCCQHPCRDAPRRIAPLLAGAVCGTML